MAASTTAKRVQLLIVVFVSAALLLRLGITIFDPDPAPDDPDLLTRMVRFFSYFTIQSNIVVLLAGLAVLKDKPLDDPWWRTLRLASMVGITVTGIVYMTILAGDSDLHGLSQLANYMLHYVGPPLAVFAWLIYGPWPAMTLSDVPRTLIWPLVWVAYTLIRGAIVDWYPYPFIDVELHGYGKVAVNILAITIFAIVLSLAYVGLSRWRRPVSPR
ncbi:MAG: Pr6Pr family membrane protein [Thermoleophilaceae bacterium]|nr:Pr6Pr family membrane protein [Thermoleophilaceae bacterium]